MSEVLKNLLTSNGMTSAEMTRALKIVGNGSMQEGIKVVSEVVANNTNKNSFNIGMLAGGTIVTVVIGSILFAYLTVKEKTEATSNEKDIDEKEKKIYNAVLQSRLDCKERDYCSMCGCELNSDKVCPECGYRLKYNS